MSSPPFPNRYHHRLTPPTSSRPCTICYKPSTSVLITPDNADWFYICPSHLQDRGFASEEGVEVETEEEKWKREEREKREKEEKERLDKEVEKVKAEWEKKNKGKVKKEEKKEEEKEDGEDKGKEGDKDGDKKKEGEEKKGPRVYVLHRKIFEMRVNRLRQQQQAKRNLEMLKSPGLSVPKGGPV